MMAPVSGRLFFLKAALFPVCGATTRKAKKQGLRYLLIKTNARAATPASTHVLKTPWTAKIRFLSTGTDVLFAAFVWKTARRVPCPWLGKQ